MDGFKIVGKASIVFDEFKKLAEQNKGKTVYSVLIEQRKDRLERVEAKQFGMTVEEFRRTLGNEKQKKQGV